MLLNYDDVKTIVLDNQVSDIEIRFDYKHGLTPHKYKKIMSYLDKDIYRGQELLSTNNYGNYTKNTVITKDNLTTYYEKKNVGHIYNENYDVDIAIVQIVPKESTQITNKIRNKIKNNYQFGVGSAQISIELSEIVEDYEKQKYEMELKYKHENFLQLNKNDVKVLNKFIYTLLLKLNETAILYSLKTKHHLMDDYDKLDIKKPICKFVTSDVVGMQCTQSIKAVGKKRMLIFHTSGLWLVGGDVYNLLIDSKTLHNVLYSYNTSVFEGVVVKAKDHDEYEFNYNKWFLCYDCLALSGKNIQCERFDKRFDAMLELNKRIGFYIDETYFKYSLQSIKYSDTPDKFHDNCRYLLSLTKEINYNADGIMITPINDCVRYKWVDVKDVSTNFVLYNGNLYYGSEGGNVKFTGTDKYPMKLLEEAFIENYQGDKKIVECVYDPMLKKMVISKIRDDADKSDSVDVILDNWHYINHPISEEDIKGDSMYFAMKYMKGMFKEFYDSYNGDNYVVDNLSPYWKDEETLDSFVNEVVKYEKIFFMSIDGEAVLHLFDSDEDVVEIIFDDTTTIKKRETDFEIIMDKKKKKYNYVFINDLTYKLGEYNYSLKMYEHVMNEQLLTTEANAFSALYVYGYYQKI